MVIKKTYFVCYFSFIYKCWWAYVCIASDWLNHWFSWIRMSYSEMIIHIMSLRTVWPIRGEVKFVRRNWFKQGKYSWCLWILCDTRISSDFQNEMSVLSKYFEDAISSATCRDIVHPHTDSCLHAARGYFFKPIWSTVQFFVPLFMVSEKF